MSKRTSRAECRPLDEWVAMLENLDFIVETAPMHKGKPFANIMLVCHLPK